jgi:hypothetical protein
MLKLLQAIFGKADDGGYPEALIKQAIERAVDATEPGIRAISGYGRKLRPAIIRSIDHVVTMVDALPPPIQVRFAGYDDDPVLKSYFISAKELRDVFSKDPALVEFMKGSEEGAARIFALMAMEKQERVTFGAAMSGDIVIKDVPIETVCFDGHRLIDPSADEALSRRALKIRAFDHLLSLALKRLIFFKSERGDLERHRTLLQAKLDLFSRQGWGFDPSASAGQAGPVELEEQLAEIEAQLQGLGGDSSENEAYLQVVAEVMGAPEQYLLAKSEQMFVNKLGIKQKEAGSDIHELSFIELHNAEGRRLVVMPVVLETEELRSLAGAAG